MKGKKKIALALCLILCLGCFVPQGVLAAKRPHLSKTEITVQTGRTKKLKVLNNKKKVTWTSKRKSIATVTKQGRVRGIAPGTTKITAKVGGKKYVCVVHVKFSAKYARKHIKIRYVKTPRSVVAYITNNNRFPLWYNKCAMHYYDANNHELKTNTSPYHAMGSLCAPVKKTVVVEFMYPSKNLDYFEPHSYKIELKIKPSIYKDLSRKIKITKSVADGKASVTVKNIGKKTIKTIRVSAVLYGADGTIYDVVERHFTFLHGLKPGESKTEEYGKPLINSQYIDIARVEAYADYVYSD